MYPLYFLLPSNVHKKEVHNLLCSKNDLYNLYNNDPVQKNRCPVY
jgi:hypothetical protein